MDFLAKKEVCIGEKFEKEDEIAYLKDHIQIQNNRANKLNKDIASKKTEDAQKLTKINKKLIAEKSKFLKNFPQKFRHIKDVNYHYL